MRKTKQPEGRPVWEKRFEEFQASGKTQAAWCKENNINPRTFNFWYLKLQREQTQPQKNDKRTSKMVGDRCKKRNRNKPRSEPWGNLPSSDPILPQPMGQVGRLYERRQIRD